MRTHGAHGVCNVQEILSKSQDDALKENGDVLSAAYKDGHSTIGKFPSDERKEAADFFNDVMTYTSGDHST